MPGAARILLVNEDKMNIVADKQKFLAKRFHKYIISYKSLSNFGVMRQTQQTMKHQVNKQHE